MDSRDGLSLNTGAGMAAASTRPHKLTGRHEYVQAFTPHVLPLLEPFNGETVSDVRAEKYGFTADVRALWSGMVEEATWPRDSAALIDQMSRSGVGGARASKKFQAKVRCSSGSCGATG